MIVYVPGGIKILLISDHEIGRGHVLLKKSPYSISKNGKNITISIIVKRFNFGSVFIVVGQNWRKVMCRRLKTRHVYNDMKVYKWRKNIMYIMTMVVLELSTEFRLTPKQILFGVLGTEPQYCLL